MFSFAIKNTSSPEWFFLMELTIQCALAKRAYTRIVEYSHIEMKKPREAVFFEPEEGFEVIADCTAFLSAAAVIAKLLFPRKRNDRDVARRASELCNKIGVTTLPNLNSTAVRDHFEHVDERLDRIIHNHPDEMICQVHVSRDMPSYSVVLRRFDPVALSISFLGDTLDLKACAEEIDALERLLVEAKKTPLDRREEERKNGLAQNLSPGAG